MENERVTNGKMVSDALTYEKFRFQSMMVGLISEIDRKIKEDCARD